MRQQKSKPLPGVSPTDTSAPHNYRMHSLDPSHTAPANPQKARSGLNRIWHATGYSIEGLRAGWNEKAFRQEAVAAMLLVPLSFWLGRSWVEVALLAGSVVIVMIVELLNTGIETAIDRIGPEWHDLSKRAKDMGSAAVLLSLLLCIGVWCAALFQRFSHG
jgi:diacylglycerol kinase (ATP)